MYKKDRKSVKSGLHPKNPFRNGYDFDQLILACPELKPYVQPNKYGHRTINFFDPDAVKVLNRALLFEQYKLKYWDIPEGYLCPPIPGRADYIHYIGDLLASHNKGKVPRGHKVRGLDIGTGASCIYPILGQQTFNWSMVGIDTDAIAIQSSQKIIDENKLTLKNITLRHQDNTADIYNGIILPNERFDFTMCNPPFYNSPEEADKNAYRKYKNLNKDNSKKFTRNFGGQPHELWCDGGELQFIMNIIKQSQEFSTSCFLFSTLVSQESHLDEIYKELQKTGISQMHTINMSQGQKTMRFVAWSFLTAKQQKYWAQARWNKG